MEGLVLRLAVQATTGLGRLEIGGIVRLLFNGSGPGQQSWSPGHARKNRHTAGWGKMLKVGSPCFCSGFELLPVVFDLILLTREDMVDS